MVGLSAISFALQKEGGQKDAAPNGRNTKEIKRIIWRISIFYWYKTS